MTDYTGGIVSAIVEAAYGADPDGDPGDWVWTRIPAGDVRDTGISIRKGRQDEAGRPQPTEVTLSLLNLNGQYTPANPLGQHYPNIVRNLPIRILVPYGSNPTTERATAFVDSYAPNWDEKRRPVVDIVASGRTRRMQQGIEPPRSAMRRSLEGKAYYQDTPPVAYWPMEDEQSATFGASAVARSTPMSVSGVTFAADSSIPGSAPLPTLQTGGSLQATLPIQFGIVPAQLWCCMVAMKIPASPTTSALVMELTSSGSAARWQLELVAGSPDTLRLTAYAADHTTSILSTSVTVDEGLLFGRPAMFGLQVAQVGSNVAYEAWAFYSDGSGHGLSGTLASRSHGFLRTFLQVAGVDLNNATTGHVVVYTDPAFDIGSVPWHLFLRGHSGETPWARFVRITDEEPIPSDVFGFPDLPQSPMGPQPIAPLLDVLQECADVDLGMMHDGATAGRLELIMRESRYNAATAMTIDNARGQLAKRFGPRYDDQRIVNDVTVSRRGGSSYPAVDEASIAREGRYTTELTLNLGRDRSTQHIASWLVHLGTVDGLRYPQVGIDLHAHPEMASAWLNSRIGSRVQVINLPAGHPPGPIDLIIEGYTEVITGERWMVDLVCSPASPWEVFQLEDPVRGRLGALGYTLSAGINATQTTLTTVRPLGSGGWVTTATHPARFPFDIEVGGRERMTVTGITLATNTYTFTVARSINGVVMAHSSGAAIQLASPAVLAL